MQSETRCGEKVRYRISRSPFETRLTYLPELIGFIGQAYAQLNVELRGSLAGSRFTRGTAFSFRNQRAVQHMLVGTTAFITESRSCFENLAAFYCQFLETYRNRTISKPASYNVVKRCTGRYAWATALYRIRGDLIHARSLFLAFDLDSPGWPPIFSMNWRPGHFGRADRIEFRTIARIWEGLFQASSAMREKIVRIAKSRRR